MWFQMVSYKEGKEKMKWKCNECGEIVSGMEEQFNHHSRAHWGFQEKMMMELTWTQIGETDYDD